MKQGIRLLSADEVSRFETPVRIRLPGGDAPGTTGPAVLLAAGSSPREWGTLGQDLPASPAKTTLKKE